MFKDIEVFDIVIFLRVFIFRRIRRVGRVLVIIKLVYLYCFSSRNLEEVFKGFFKKKIFFVFGNKVYNGIKVSIFIVRSYRVS